LRLSVAIGTGDDRDDGKELRQEKPDAPTGRANARLMKSSATSREGLSYFGFRISFGSPFAGIWTEFKGDRGTQSKPIPGGVRSDDRVLVLTMRDR